MKGLLPICIIAIILLPTIFFACSSEEQLPQLTSKQRARIDTLVSKGLEAMRPELDSLCDLQFNSLVVKAVDSLLEIRKKEEVLLRELTAKRLQEENE